MAGSARGRRLAVPPGASTRPTSDRAREGLFSTLESMLHSLAGARVLDLFAGSGAVGLEAASRGAAHVLLVESDPRAVRTLRANAAAVATGQLEVRADRVLRVVDGGPPPSPYDVVFLDPPYGMPDGDVHTVLDALRDHRWLRPGSLVIVERASRDGAWRWPLGYRADRSRRYGEATLWYGRAAGPASEE